MSDTEEVTQLVLRERQRRDRGWWAEMEQARDEFYRRTWAWLRGGQEK